MKLFEVLGVIKVDNKQANQAFDSTEKKGSSLGSRFGKLTKGSVALNAALAGIAIVAVKAIADITKASIKAFDDQEKAEKRLVSIAKTVTKATDAQIESLKKLASAYQEVTTFGDDVIISGQSQLLSYGITTDSVAKLTEGLTDLIAANKGMDATQEDAINAANMFGKALSGQVGALSRAGILLDERQANLLKTGNETQKVAALTEILNQNYGGLAKGLAETREGQMIQFKNALSDIGEKFAAVLMPALTGFTKFLKGSVIPALDGFVDWIAIYGPKIFGVFATVFGTVIDVIKPLIPLFTDGLMPIINGFINLVTNDFGTVATIFRVTVRIIMSVLEPLIWVLTETLRGLGMIVDFVADYFGDIGADLIASFEGVYDFLIDLDEKIRDVFESLLELFGLTSEQLAQPLLDIQPTAPFTFNVPKRTPGATNENNQFSPFGDLQGKVENNFQNGAIQVTIPVEDLAQIQDVTDFFERIPELRRGRTT